MLMLNVAGTSNEIGERPFLWQAKVWNPLFSAARPDLPIIQVFSNQNLKYISSIWLFLHGLSCCFQLWLISGMIVHLHCFKSYKNNQYWPQRYVECRYGYRFVLIRYCFFHQSQHLVAFSAAIHCKSLCW